MVEKNLQGFLGKITAWDIQHEPHKVFKEQGVEQVRKDTSVLNRRSSGHHSQSSASAMG